MDGAAPATSPSRFSVLSAGLAPASAAEAERVARLRAVEDDVAVAIQPRETPLAGVTPDDPGSLLRAAAIAEAVGPITSVDGRELWFDLLPLVRLVPVYFAGDTEPALLFTLRERRFPLGVPLPIPEIIGLLTQQYRLGAGSIWLRADLLTSDAPTGRYIGLTITSGIITFQPRPTDVAGRLTIPAGGQCGVELVLASPPPPPASGGRAGADAADASLVTPPNVSFRLSGGHAAVAALGDAHWEVFGQATDFRWEQGAPTYEATLRAVVVPMTVTIAAVEPVTVESPMVTLAASGPVDQSGWLLPATVINVSSPPQASGAGGLGVRAGSGMTIGWTGLRRGPVTLTGPWLVLVPGIVGLIETAADNRYASERLELWEDGRTPFRSRVDVRCSDAFPLSFSSSAAGTELLIITTAFDAALDRPVDVRGTPLAIHARHGRLMFTITDAATRVRLGATGLLADALALRGTYPVDPGGSISLAIHNALFTTTPADSLMLTGTMVGPEQVSPGTTTVTLGLYGLLPTLPDPYAANVGWLLAGRQVRGQEAAVIALLQATVGWTPSAAPDGSDTVTTSFAFAPVGALVDDFVLWARARQPIASRQRVMATTGLDATSPAPTPAGAAAYRYERDQSDEVWDRYFGAFEQEQFALLDVSTNADQMGVSFAWFDPARIPEGSPVARRVYGSGPEIDPTGFPLLVHDLDLSAESRFVRAFTVPQISWEPIVNLTLPDVPADPPFGFVFFADDGGPTRLFNDATDIVPIAPLPVIDFLQRDFEQRANGFTGGLFTLPFGMRAFAEFSRLNQFTNQPEGAAKISRNGATFSGGGLVGGLQVRVDAPRNDPESPIFQGATQQRANLVDLDGTPTGTGTLGNSVGIVFNDEFFLDPPTGFKPRGVPVTRIDFSGYGASLFSHWENPNAIVAATSQVYFDVFVGRTGHEVVQIRSLLYPWGVRVVRTITLLRGGNGYVFRTDSGWQAESAGVFDFHYVAYKPSPTLPRPTTTIASPYTVHPGIVHGVHNVRNIHETTSVPPFQTTWNKASGETYIDPEGVLQPVPATGLTLDVLLQPVTFDADVDIEGVTSGAAGGLVPSTGMLGFVQLKPRGEPLSAAVFTDLLNSQFGSLGGPVDSVIDIAGSGQAMRISRVDVSPSFDGGDRIFVAAARGALQLPKTGAWSVVQHDQGSGDVSPLDPQTPVPVIRRGVLDVTTGTTDATGGDLYRLANPVDLVTPPSASSRNYGLLQSTGTQKALFRLPSYQTGVTNLLGAPPDFADAYRIVNSVGIFPNVGDAVSLALGALNVNIVPEGFKLADAGGVGAVLDQALPRGPLYLINEEFLKLYVDYAPADKEGDAGGATGSVHFGFDSTAAGAADQWLSKVNDISMVVDLGSLTRIMTIRGRFDAENGSEPGFREPVLEFSDVLKPVIEILQVLSALSTGDYADALKKGLDVAMTNSADSWSYAFHARQEIPVVKFPPEPEYSTSAVDPLKLQAQMAIGVYFNEAMQVTSDPSQLVPSAGAFLEFGGSLSVMCVSLAAATVYATGSVDLVTAADIKTGPSLHMKFGFGAEVVVGLPVIGGVTITYMAGVQVDLDTGSITVAAFLLFRGRVELLGGLVCVQIQIEASGSLSRSGSPERTDIAAQVTFGLDISIFLVINISFSQSWQESRQIA